VNEITFPIMNELCASKGKMALSNVQLN